MENPTSNYLYRQWKMLVDEWINYQIGRLKEEDYLLELSPGKNHGVFILGHLVASDDDFSVYMGKGGYLFPEYQEIFSAGSELQSVNNYPTVKEILEKWKAVCDKNEKIYKELTDAELNEYHANCENPEKDFFKTKERIIQMWQVHQAYHVGQLGLLESIAKSQRAKEVNFL